MAVPVMPQVPVWDWRSVPRLGLVRRRELALELRSESQRLLVSSLVVFGAGLR